MFPAFMFPAFMFAVFMCTVSFCNAASAAPKGFVLQTSATGLQHWKKNYTGGQPDHVIVVDLAKAHLRSFHGGIKDAGSGKGPLGGPSPTFSRLSLAGHYSAVKAKHGNVFAVVNAQFFVTASNPTPLAFSVRKDGKVLADGYGIKAEFPGQIRLFQAHGPAKWARITNFSEAELKGGAAPEMVAVLDENANKGVYTKTGRTFVGVRDANKDGKGETAYLFCTKYTNQKEAAKVLKDFGATSVGMMDGGGSSQLIVKGKSQVYSSRTIPHVLAALSGPAPKPPATGPQMEIWSHTHAKDFRPEGKSKGIGDALVGQTFFVDIFVRCKASGAKTPDHVQVGFWLQAPWLKPVTYRIHSDWPHKDTKTWSVNDSDGFKHNPSKSKPPVSGKIDISAMSPGETKRIRFTVRAADYSIAKVDHPDVRAWIWHVGGYYGEQTGWDDKVETNKAGKLLRTYRQHDVWGDTFWRWNGGKTQTEGWVKGGDIGTLAVNDQDHCLAVKGSGGDPWIRSDTVAFAAKAFEGFRLRVRSYKGAKKSQLHWLTSKDGTWTGSKSARFQVPGDGKFHDVMVRTKHIKSWTGTITRLRIDPSLGSKQWYDIDWMRADKNVPGTSGDKDLDGWLAVDDCNDSNAAIHPKAKEACNGKDDDCDGKTDEAVKNACGGCGAVPKEACNGKDDDCDGKTDEGCPTKPPPGGADAGGAGEVDAGGTDPAGSDAGSAADSGMTIDAGQEADAAVFQDAGGAVAVDAIGAQDVVWRAGDATAALDVDGVGLAGRPTATTGEAGRSSSGCSSSAVPASAPMGWLLLLGLGVPGLWRRRSAQNEAFSRLSRRS